ncbi:unnamed protein product, partial [Mesorhabditis belari]|uniref:UPAR/Ly6 domain-containing protein n=1 Tax=Mesorhabditis belari TaxID=2138241 RepID=A0AAF3ENJ8_9BILA
MQLLTIVTIFYLGLFPLSQAIECYSDSQADGQSHPSDLPRIVSCSNDCSYCGKLRMKVQYSTRYQSLWGCGCGTIFPAAPQICYKNGRISVPNGDLFCCSGDRCNSMNQLNHFLISSIRDNHVGFETSQVCSAGCEYCVKVNGMDLAKPVSGWGCGCGVAYTMNVLPCTGTGITNLAAYQGNQYCCQGDLCNFTASKSLFPVFLIIGFFAALMQ